MAVDLDDVRVFAAVARAGGFREASRTSGTSASSASEAVRRLEGELGVRLLHRTTRSVAPTEAGARLLERLGPALAEIAAALDVVKELERKASWHAPVERPRRRRAARAPSDLAAVPRRISRYPRRGDGGRHARRHPRRGLRRRHSLRRDARERHDRGPDRPARAAPGARRRRAAYLERHGRPTHPRKLLDHACSARPLPERRAASVGIRARRRGREGRPDRPARRSTLGSATDLLVDAAIAGTGLVYWFEELAAPAPRERRPGAGPGALVVASSGPFLYYPSRRHMPAALRAFVDFIRADSK